MATPHLVDALGLQPLPGAGLLESQYPGLLSQMIIRQLNQEVCRAQGMLRRAAFRSGPRAPVCLQAALKLVQPGGQDIDFFGQQAGQLHQRFLGATFLSSSSISPKFSTPGAQLGVCVAADLDLVDSEFNQRGRRGRPGRTAYTRCAGCGPRTARGLSWCRAGRPGGSGTGPEGRADSRLWGDEQPLFDFFADLNGAVAQTQPLESQGLLTVAVAQDDSPSRPEKSSNPRCRNSGQRWSGWRAVQPL